MTTRLSTAQIRALVGDECGDDEHDCFDGLCGCYSCIECNPSALTDMEDDMFGPDDDVDAVLPARPAGQETR